MMSSLLGNNWFCSRYLIESSAAKRPTSVIFPDGFKNFQTPGCLL